MLFRCYSRAPSDGDGCASSSSLGPRQSLNIGINTQKPQNTPPSGDLIFCRFSFPPSLCIIKSRRIAKSLRWGKKKQKSRKRREREDEGRKMKSLKKRNLLFASRFIVEDLKKGREKVEKGRRVERRRKSLEGKDGMTKYQMMKVAAVCKSSK